MPVLLQPQDPFSSKRQGGSSVQDPSMPPFTHAGTQTNFAQAASPVPPSNMPKGEARCDILAPRSEPSTIYASPRKRSLPPPPRDGEKANAPEFYAFMPAVHPTTHPSSSLSVSPRSSIGGPSAVTVMTRSDSFQPAATRSQTQFVVQDVRVGSFEHPSGYKQNPYAADMTPEQRFATEQEDQPECGQVLPMPNNCTQNRRQSTASIVMNYLLYPRRNTEDLFEGFQDWLSKNVL